MRRKNLSPLRVVVRRAIFALVAAWMLSGCAAAPDATQPPREAASLVDRQMSAAERSRRWLLGPEFGLEIREWVVEAEAEAIARQLLRFRAGDAIEEDQRQRLRRNGLRLMRIRVDDLDELEAALGYVSLNRRGWHGQVVEWLPIHGYAAGGAHRGVFIDGRARRFDEGEYRLVTRAWTVLMEDGPRMNLQIVPEYHRSGQQSLRRLLGRDGDQAGRRGEPIASIALDLLIEPGYCLILTGEMPNVDWDGSSSGDAMNARQESGGSERGMNERASGPTDHLTHLGPATDVPVTLGEMLFVFGGARRGRGMLIFVPKVPDEIMPQVTQRRLPAE